MHALRFAAPSIPRLRLHVAAAIEWISFAAALFVFVQTFRGHMRSAGPVLLLVLLLPALVTDAIAFPRVLLRLPALAVAVLGSGLLFGMQFESVEAWLGWHLLLGGLGFVLVDAIPAPVKAQLGKLFEHMTARPNGAAAALFSLLAIAVPAAFLFLTTKIAPFSGDTMPTVATVVRVYRDGTRDLTPYQEAPRQKRWMSYANQTPPYNMHPTDYAPGLYSAYPAGMEVFAWPSVLLDGFRGRDLRDDDVQCQIEYRTAAVLAALGLALFFLTALHVTDALAAFLTTAALATGSVYFTTFGQLLWQQGGVAFWITVVLFVEVRSEGKPKLLGILTQGIACGLMLACRPLAALFLAPFGISVFLRDWKRGLLVPAIAVATFSPFSVVYWELHHSLLGPAVFLYAGIGCPDFDNFCAVLFSPGRGLFLYQPLLLLLPLALLPWFRSERLGRLGFYPLALVFAAAHCLFISGWVMWWGGHCLGSRLVGEVVPLAALAVAPIVGQLLRFRIGSLTIAAVLVFGFLVHHNLAYHRAIMWNVDPVDVDLETSRIWKWTDPQFAYRYRSN